MQSSQSSNILRFLSLMKPHAWLMGLAILAGMTRLLVPIFMPWGIKVIIDDVLRNPTDSLSFRQLHIIIVSLLIIMLVWSIFNFARLYLSGVAGNRTIFDLRHSLFEHFQKMSIDFFQKQKIGEIVSRLTQDISKAEDLITYLVPITLMEAGTIIAISVIMLVVHWKLALVCLILLPIYAIVSHRFAQQIRKISRSVQERLASMTGSLHERFLGHAVVLAFSRQDYEESKYLKGAKEHYEAADLNFRHQAFGIAVAGFLSSIAPLIVIWYGSVCVLNHSLTVGELVAFYAYVGLLYNPVSRLTEMYVTTAQSFAATDRIFEAMNYEPEIKDHVNSVRIENVKGQITFKHVSFSYMQDNEQDQIIFKDLNFTIKPGECVHLHGPSGSGKSTITKLLLRFYDVHSGAISIDNADIRGVTLSSLREHIGYVSQEPILFSGSILENIVYGHSCAKKYEVVQAAQWANAHDFIVGLPKGYDTEVGERGVKLSVGQKQRIAIARALLKNPAILVLDEPTSALDDISSFLVQENLKEIRKNKTTLWITHQLCSANCADRVLQLSEGQLKEVFQKPTSSHSH